MRNEVGYGKLLSHQKKGESVIDIGKYKFVLRIQRFNCDKANMLDFDIYILHVLRKT